MHLKSLANKIEMQPKDLLSDIHALQNLMRERVSIMHITNSSSKHTQDYYLHAADGSLADLIIQSGKTANDSISGSCSGERAVAMRDEIDSLHEEFHMRVADHLCRFVCPVFVLPLISTLDIFLHEQDEH